MHVLVIKIFRFDKRNGIMLISLISICCYSQLFPFLSHFTSHQIKIFKTHQFSHIQNHYQPSKYPKFIKIIVCKHHWHRANQYGTSSHLLFIWSISQKYNNLLFGWSFRWPFIFMSIYSMKCFFLLLLIKCECSFSSPFLMASRSVLWNKKWKITIKRSAVHLVMDRLSRELLNGKKIDENEMEIHIFYVKANNPIPSRAMTSLSN